MENFNDLKYEVLKFELDVPISKTALELEFMLYDYLKQPNHFVIDQAKWIEFIFEKLKNR
jgi:hypothetical protein